ncbi:winged helix-turn-helix domain-containing protein [Coralloluteibacterium thermophilus]|uniref:Winged helix-turn-helix domain-containing protein n=1 Tax=Coralloluteibacterium thermophilum TaxID=2707049 RepID=A0ABV9NNB0_9GAMM
MSALRLAARQARRLHLHAQGLAAPPRRRARPEDVVDAVRRMQLLQIDTIQVVARSPYLVLFSRLGGYPREWLDQALARGALFETWAHEACFAPIETLHLHGARDEPARHWARRRAERMLAEHPQAMHALLDHVRRHGEARSSDFERSGGAAQGWWDWKLEKQALEAWFALGALMVARRENLQRVYALRETVLARAGALPEPPVPDPAARRREVVLRSVQALGIARARWIADYFRIAPRVGPEELAPLVEAGHLLRVEVDGWPDPGYVHAAHAGALEAAAAGRLKARHTTLLSPFDPVVWDRERARALFGFDYRIECYVPEPRRRYGYFVLPILRGDALVGRLDAKAHRSEGVFEVRGLWLEEGVRASSALLKDIATAVARAAAWHGTPEVRVLRTRPSALLAPLRAAVAAVSASAAPVRRARAPAA